MRRMQRQRDERPHDEAPDSDDSGAEDVGAEDSGAEDSGAEDSGADGPVIEDADTRDAVGEDASSGDAVAERVGRERSDAEHAEAAHPCGDHEDVGDELIIDCDRCRVRGDACRDCVVSVLLGPPPELRWDRAERRAVDALADGGVIPHLRLVPVEPVQARDQADDGRCAG